MSTGCGVELVGSRDRRLSAGTGHCSLPVGSLPLSSQLCSPCDSDWWIDMLARLSHHSARWFNLREHSLSMCDGQGALIGLNLASSLVPVDLWWCRLVGLCEKSVLPAYGSLKDVLERDVDHVSKLLSELGPLAEESEDHFRTERTVSGEPRGFPSIEPVFTPHGLHPSDPVNPERRKRKRRRSSIPQEPIVIRPTHTLAPTIVITPCPPQSRETSCWVPYQDASFGTHLTVPTHTALNSTHPPMVAPTDTAVIQIDDWEYARGHWHAVIPLPEEQCRRGMFSRTVPPRRRARCPPCRTGGLFL